MAQRRPVWSTHFALSDFCLNLGSFSLNRSYFQVDLLATGYYCSWPWHREQDTAIVQRQVQLDTLEVARVIYSYTVNLIFPSSLSLSLTHTHIYIYIYIHTDTVTHTHTHTQSITQSHTQPQTHLKQILNLSRHNTCTQTFVAQQLLL